MPGFIPYSAVEKEKIFSDKKGKGKKKKTEKKGKKGFAELYGKKG